MIGATFFVFYVAFSALVALLLRGKRKSFGFLFVLSLIFTPLVVSVAGLVFSED